MAININRYVDITSGVGAGSAVPERELITRIFTTNNLVPPGVIALEFESTAEVGEYFGFTSEEYDRAIYYFGWISKNITRPKKISFSRWVDTAVAPRIYGEIRTQTLSAWTSISNGSFKLTISGTTTSFTGVDFTGAASLTAVAALIQTEIRTGSGTMLTAATVTWNSTRSSFDFVGGEAVATTNILVESGTTGTSIANQMGWLEGTGLILANGSLAETITETLTTSAELSNNFGSFLFTTAASLSLPEIVDAAVWNNTFPQNVSYMFLVPVTLALANDYYTDLIDYAGTAITIQEADDQYAEMFPGMIMAATDYNATNSVQNYMYQQTALTPSITTDALADTLDTIRINYYGLTQSAGRQLAFYQRGVLMGTITAPQDMNTYANEAWLKNAADSAIINLLLAAPQIPANIEGRGQLLGVLQGPISRALNNGTISVGKTLTDAQKLYITEVSGDSNAWHQVQNVGYWIDCVIIRVVDGDLVTYEAAYTLIYSKDDTVRKVNGQHILI